MKKFLGIWLLILLFSASLFANNDFIVAAKDGDIARVENMLSSGVNVNVKNSRGDTALIVASSEGHADIVELLISKKVDINAKNRNGQTAFMIASDNGHYEVVIMLRTSGAK